MAAKFVGAKHENVLPLFCSSCLICLINWNLPVPASPVIKQLSFNSINLSTIGLKSLSSTLLSTVHFLGSCIYVSVL